jgi:hypothetical protein
MTVSRNRILKLISVIFLVLVISFVALSYFWYLDLKSALILKVSHKAASLFGQGVDIGDFTFGPSGGITLQDIVIRNPEGFPKGKLLSIKRLYVDIRLRELFRGRLSFRAIEIYSPELTLVTDKDKRLNMAEELKQFLLRKSTLSYQIDSFTVQSGNVDIPPGFFSGVRNVNFSVRNLSSLKDTKTLIKGTMAFAGSPVQIDGSIFLNDPSRKFTVSFLSEEFGLSAFKEVLKGYPVDAGKVTFKFHMNAEGDALHGCKIFSTVRLKKGGVSDMRMEGEVFLNLKDHSVFVRELSWYDSDVRSVRLSGEVTDISGNPSYRADIQIPGIDLSHYHFIKDMKMSGMITSDHLEVKGKTGETMPEISGSVRLSRGTIKSAQLDIQEASADLVFSTDKEMSLNAEASAKVLRLNENLITRPAGIVLSVRAKGKPDKMTMHSSLQLSPLSIRMGEKSTFSSDSLAFTFDGTAEKGTSFQGRILVEMKNITSADYRIQHLNGSLTMEYRDNLITMRDVKVSAGEARASAGSVVIRVKGQKEGYWVEGKDINAVYPHEEAEIKRTDFRLNVRTAAKKLSGELAFSFGPITCRGVPSEGISGTAQFNEKEFSITIPDAKVAGGKASLRAKGNVSKAPFRVQGEMSTEHVDLGLLSRALSKVPDIPFSVSGTLTRASFSGSAEFPLSLYGRASVEAMHLSLIKKEGGKTLVKDIGMRTDVTCTGKECEFTTDMAAGHVETKSVGVIRGLAEKDRELTLRVTLPETKITDIRNSMWDVFPDGLLYARLDGTLSSEVVVNYRESGIKVSGDLRLKEVILEGENGEYSAGPIDGTVPIRYQNTVHDAVEIPSFERSEFANLARYYSQEKVSRTSHGITIGSLRYGFPLLDTIDIRIDPQGNILKIDRISANIFGGRMYGSALVDISGGVSYRAGILLEQVSLTKLCGAIEPIKGYISGKVDGIATIKGSGMGLSHLIGKAEFWTYSSKEEKTRISKEFLQKIGGTSLKTYLGDRSFNKGVMNLYLQNGFVIFRELEISNRNLLGMNDLSVKVAPFNNRIGIDHLMWTITEAAQRAKSKE